MQAITLRKLTVADAEILLPFSRKIFYDSFAHQNSAESMDAYAEKAFTIEKLTEEISNPDSEFYFALLNDTLAGYLKLNVNQAQTEFKEPNALEVERIYVDVAFQGLKIGERLLNFAIDIARERKFNYVWLGVWEHNQRAIKFYQRNGFHVVGSHNFLLGNEEQTDLVMRKELDG